jgi:ABC-2 type transport system permease protein
VSHRPPGTLQVLKVLAGSAVRRLLRAQQIAMAVRAEKKGRTGTRKPRSGAGITMLLVLALPMLLFSALSQSAQAVERIASDSERFERPQVDVRIDATRRASDEHLMLMTTCRRTDPPQVQERIVASGALLLGLVMLILVASSIGSANLELGRAAWSFPWLLTFPVPTHAIVIAKIAECALVQLFPWFLAFPLIWQLGRALGLGGTAPLLAAVATLSIAAATGALRFWLETWMRLRLPLQRVRSVQGTCALLAVAGFALLFMVGLAANPPQWFRGASEATRSFTPWLPWAWPLHAARGQTGPAIAGLIALALVPAFAAFACTRLLRHGSERSGGNDSGRKVATSTRLPAPLRPLGILRKELLLLGRDRNFLVQTLGVPLFVIGMQVFMQNNTLGTFSRMAPVLAYFVAAMALSTGCFMVLSSEGRALWLLYTQPQTLASQLRAKILLWAGLAVAIGSITFVATSALRGDSAATVSFWVDLGCVAIGVFGAAWLAAGIGALGTDPAADHVPRMPKPRFVYLYMYLAGSYIVAIAAPTWPPRIAAMLVFGTLAWSLWQRLGDRLPWLLDPLGHRPRDISAYDAGAAVTTFMLVQMFGAPLLRPLGSHLGAAVSYAIAGGLTLAVFGLAFRSRGIPIRERLGLRRASARRPFAATLAGAAIGAGLAWLALQWLEVLRSQGWFADTLTLRVAADERWALLALGAIAAPIVEEVLFRGILFQALRRSVPARAAMVWSAALFAVVHPVPGWLPVFVLGLLAAALLARSGWLPACMVMHAVYNGIVFAFA